MSNNEIKKDKNPYVFEDFELHINLYNLICSNAKNILFLEKIVDSLHIGNFKKMPSFLFVGPNGKSIMAKALLNSLAIEEDIREVEGDYFDLGISSKVFFRNSLRESVHIIKNIENIKMNTESNLWQYLKLGRCSYITYYNNFEEIIHCNGIIILTASDITKISKPIIDAINFIIKLEPYNISTLKSIAIQRLRFCGIEFEDEAIIKIVEKGKNIKQIIRLLKSCITFINADCRNNLTLADAEMTINLT